MAINWDKALEKAPPNNNELIIAKYAGGLYQVGTGAMLHQLFQLIWENKAKVDPTWYWTVYSDELWEQLRSKS